MPEKRLLRVVVASPGDVEAERDSLRDVIDELNGGVARDRNLVLELWRWETDAYPGLNAQGPQGLIDPILKVADCDILIGIFWRRFGTPTSSGETGTEHELRTAYEAWKTTGRPQVMLYFNQKEYVDNSSEQALQRARVLEFQKDLPKEILRWSYGGKHGNFPDLVRRHIGNYLSQNFQVAPSPVQGQGPALTPPNAESKTAPGTTLHPTRDPNFGIIPSVRRAFKVLPAYSWESVNPRLVRELLRHSLAVCLVAIAARIAWGQPRLMTALGLNTSSKEITDALNHSVWFGLASLIAVLLVWNRLMDTQFVFSLSRVLLFVSLLGLACAAVSCIPGISHWIHGLLFTLFIAAGSFYYFGFGVARYYFKMRSYGDVFAELLVFILFIYTMGRPLKMVLFGE